MEPSLDAVEGAPPADIVNNERTNSASVVSRGDSSKPLLSRSVPDLRLDLFAVDLDELRLELDPNGGLGVAIELVPREPREEVGLPHRGVPNQHYLEQVLLAAFTVLRHWDSEGASECVCGGGFLNGVMKSRVGITLACERKKKSL